MFYTALSENIFGAISVLWCGFYFNRMALCKDTAEEWFCELSHFRLDTLQTANATSRTFFFFLEGGEMLLLVSCIVIDLPRAGEPSMIEVGSSCEVSGPSLLIEYHFYNVNVLKPHKPNSFHHTHTPVISGAMFGILASGEALFALLSSVAWPNIYNIVIDHNLSPGVTYMIMAGVALMTVPLLM